MAVHGIESSGGIPSVDKVTAMNFLPWDHRVAGYAFDATKAVGSSESDPSGEDSISSVERKLVRHSFVFSSVTFEKKDPGMGQLFRNVFPSCSLYTPLRIWYACFIATDLASRPMIR